MAVAFYMDAHIPVAIAHGLRFNGVDVLTAQEDGATILPDPELLDRATALQRVLFTFDDDLLAEAARRQKGGIPFAGVVFARPMQVSIGKCVSDLQLIANAGTFEDLMDQVLYLPL